MLQYVLQLEQISNMNQKTALIIGGSGGIGTEIIKRLLKDGFLVCGTYYKNADKVEILRQELAGQPVFFYKMDLLDKTAMQTAMKKIIAEHGQVDVLVFAATLPLEHKLLVDCEWEDFEQDLQVQLGGMFCVFKNLQAQIKQKCETKFIILLSAVCVGQPPSRMGSYTVAKYGLMGLAKIMAVELAQYNCTINMLSPGMVQTDLIKSFPPKLVEIEAQQNLSQKLIQPDEVATLIARLALAPAGYLNGKNIGINGEEIYE